MSRPSVEPFLSDGTLVVTLYAAKQIFKDHVNRHGCTDDAELWTLYNGMTRECVEIEMISTIALPLYSTK